MSGISKISTIVLWVLSLGTLGVLGAFYLGGDVVDAAARLEACPTSSPEMWIPSNTDLLLNWGFLVLGIGILSTLAFACFHFGRQLKDHPVEAIKSLSALVALGIMFFIFWTMGSGEELKIPGYEGDDNVYFWLKWTDMLLYSAYSLIALSIVGVSTSGLFKSFQK